MLCRQLLRALPASSQPPKFWRVAIGQSLLAGCCRRTSIAPSWGTLAIVTSPTDRSDHHVSDVHSILSSKRKRNVKAPPAAVVAVAY
jgi:hypothetical protein